LTYISLHTHSEQSELDATAELAALFKFTGDTGQGALAITDRGTLGGLLKAQKAADDTKVKLIPALGCWVGEGGVRMH
jgi:DNA polymerase III alpha subunit